MDREYTTRAGIRRGGRMRIVLYWLAAMVVLGLPAATDAQSMSDCRATPKLLELGAPLTTARKAIAEHKKLRILTISSSATESYGVSNPRTPILPS